MLNRSDSLMSKKKVLRRAGVVVAATTLGLLIGGGAASAHVTANLSGPAKKGGYTKITFRVPNEDQTAGTTKIEVAVPAEYGLTSLRTKPVAGWTAEIKKTKAGDKDVATGVVWTANPGTRIGPGEFGEFDISAGPLPKDIDMLVLPTTQTYDSGKVSAWDAPPAKDGAEPEHPAPTVPLVAGDPSGDDHGTAPMHSGEESSEHGAEGHAASTDDTARLLGGSGLLVGALGLGFGLGAMLRSRRAPAAAQEVKDTGDSTS
jgi:uncharacterized protein YcnI